MKILSLNCWGGMIHTPLLDYLAQADADVYCLQEVVRAVGPQPERLIYRDDAVTLDQRTELFREIAAVLPAHDGFFLPASRGDLCDGERSYPSEFGLATFLRSALPVIGQAAGFVHGAFSAEGWGAHPRARNAHCLRILDPASGKPLTVAQMHGLRDPAGKHDTPARERQAEAFAELIDRCREPGDRLVACGDFNVLPGSRTFEVLGRFGLSDLVTGRGFTDTRTSLYKKPGRFADYMLVTPEVEVISFEVVESPEVSDHRALLLEIA